MLQYGLVPSDVIEATQEVNITARIAQESILPKRGVGGKEPTAITQSAQVPYSYVSLDPIGSVQHRLLGVGN